MAHKTNIMTSPHVYSVTVLPSKHTLDLLPILMLQYFPPVRNAHPKLQSLLSQERIKLRTSNLAGTVKGSIGTKKAH